MSAQELHTLAQQFVDAFNKKDLKAALNMLADDLEVFDHVPYRFDNKEQFAAFLVGAMEGVASMNFGFRQPVQFIRRHAWLDGAFQYFQRLCHYF